MNSLMLYEKTGLTMTSQDESFIEKTSIQKKATPHIFRHTHISMLVEAGVDINTIMKRVGRDDKIYTHVTEKMKKMLPKRSKIILGAFNLANRKKCD